MRASLHGQNHRAVFSSMCGALGASIILSSFDPDLYKTPSIIVFLGTTLCMWGVLLIFLSRLAEMIVARYITLVLTTITTFALGALTNADHYTLSAGIVLAFSLVVVCVGATQEEKIFTRISTGLTAIAALVGLDAAGSLIKQPIAGLTIFALIVTAHGLIRSIHAPIAKSLEDALDRAEIFSTITKSSREFHSREPEEAIRNIVNVTKTLGYISVSVVSFDRRQKIFEDGVPIPNAMEVAVKASATRRVTIVEANHTDPKAKKRSRAGDIVGVPIWINGRYSAALIVQTSTNVKVTQRDCEALELLADQAGRALENAGKAAMDRRVVERLTDESQRDKLTGLGNRRFADIMVESMKVGDIIAIIDLDGLKATNDVYGHSSGDQLLHAVGVFLSDEIRAPDMVARLGGDEFMILLHEAQDAAEAILERLVKSWEEKHLFNTTFSVGMALHLQGKTTRETVEAADAALYKAKKEGKNRLVSA